MRSFFKIVLATMVGMLFASVLFFFMAVIFVSAVGSGDKEVVLKKNSVLRLTFDQPIPDRSDEDPFSDMSFFSPMNFSTSTGLNEYLKSIRKAANNDNISGIFLDLSNFSAGTATLEELRNALLDFRQSGKFVYAYSEVLSQPAYYLATAAEKIYLHPTGMAELKGLRSEVIFFKGALDKLGLQPQVFRHGKFKSAVEPFIQDKLSNENREQIKTFIGSFWNHMLAGISKQRNLSTETLQSIADNLLVTNAIEAKEQKLVDELMYKDEVLELLKTRTNAEKIDDINFVSIERLAKVKDNKERGSDRIAIVYAEGDIVDGAGEKGEVGSSTFSRAIRKARLDEKVKAVVLRINSPGGSALASETIWREVVLTKKVKPVIVSMGNVAASGGYYIACEADTIVASPNTITGSIGVFGLMVNAKPLINSIGVTVDTVKTARHADIMTPARAVSEFEAKVIQREIERIYDDFITRVSEGRGIPKDQVDSIAQGRVWSGVDAKRLGLVDVFGGLETAIDIAAKKAKLEKYRITELPYRGSTMESVLKKISGDSEDEVMQRVLGPTYKYYMQLERLMRMNGYQARLPYQVEVF